MTGLQSRQVVLVGEGQEVGGAVARFGALRLVGVDESKQLQQKKIFYLILVNICRPKVGKNGANFQQN
jgi:hypothetical protein